MGAPLWEPLTRGNPSLALRVSDDSSATPTWEEVVAYIITQVYGSCTLGLSQVSIDLYRTYIGLIQVQETKDYHHYLSAPLVHCTVSQYCLGSAPVGNRTHDNNNLCKMFFLSDPLFPVSLYTSVFPEICLCSSSPTILVCLFIFPFEKMTTEGI